MYYMVSCISSSLSASLGGRPKVPKYATRVTSQENHGFGDVSVAKSIVYVSPCLSWIQILHVPPRRGSNHNIVHDFPTHFLFLVKWASRLLQKNKNAKFICTLRQNQRSATWVVFGMPVSSSTLGMCEWVYSVYFYIWICIQLCVRILCEVYNYLYIYDHRDGLLYNSFMVILGTVLVGYIMVYHVTDWQETSSFVDVEWCTRMHHMFGHTFHTLPSRILFFDTWPSHAAGKGNWCPAYWDDPYIYIYIPEKGGDESQPPKQCSCFFLSLRWSISK